MSDYKTKKSTGHRTNLDVGDSSKNNLKEGYILDYISGQQIPSTKEETQAV